MMHAMETSQRHGPQKNIYVEETRDSNCTLSHQLQTFVDKGTPMDQINLIPQAQ